jgi:hypothetical protein
MRTSQTGCLEEADRRGLIPAGCLAVCRVGPVARDFDSAVLSARKALGRTVDALLESEGHFGARTPKWRAWRFRDSRPKALSFEEYWALETVRPFDPDDPQTWVNLVVQRCTDLTLEVEIS